MLGNEVKKKIKIQLIGFEQIHVSSHKDYRGEELNKLLRGFGGRYDPNMRGYILEFRRYEEVLSGIKNYLLSKKIAWVGVLEGIPKSTLDYVKPLPVNLTFKVTLKNNLGEDVNDQRIQIGYDEDEEREKSITTLPAKFGQKLYGFQKEGIEFGIRRYGRILFGDEMGVGKTIQALGLAAVYESDWPCLVVCPASLKYNWKSEISEWLPDLVFDGECKILQHGYEPLRDNVKFIILSYDLAKRIPERLAEINFNVVIVDEAHYLKNDKSKRSETLTPLFKACKRVIMLTGTPALARPKELYSILNCVRPDLYTDFISFGKRYCQNHKCYKPGAEFDGSENMEELNFVLKNVMIRRLKKDVLTELPSKIRQKVMIRTSGPKVAEILRLRDKVEYDTGQKISSIIDSLSKISHSNDPSETAEFASSGLETILQKGNEGTSKRAYSNAMTCYEMSSHCKLEGVLEFLEEMEDYDKKIVVFAFHKVMIEGLESWADKKNQEYIRIDGRVDSMKRGHLVERFQTDPKCKYAFLSLAAASTGLTLTAASTVVFAELNWTPALIIQAEDRCHRISQKETVNCYYLIGENTMDDIIYAMIKAKFDVTSKILDGDNAQKLNVDESRADSLILKLSKEELDQELADIDAPENDRTQYGESDSNTQDTGFYSTENTEFSARADSLFSKPQSLFSSSNRFNSTNGKTNLQTREGNIDSNTAIVAKESSFDQFWKEKQAYRSIDPPASTPPPNSYPNYNFAPQPHLQQPNGNFWSQSPSTSYHGDTFQPSPAPQYHYQYQAQTTSSFPRPASENPPTLFRHQEAINFYSATQSRPTMYKPPPPISLYTPQSRPPVVSRKEHSAPIIFSNKQEKPSVYPVVPDAAVNQHSPPQTWPTRPPPPTVPPNNTPPASLFDLDAFQFSGDRIL